MTLDVTGLGCKRVGAFLLLMAVGCGDEDEAQRDPAALVSTTLASRVGILLDEIPEAHRERAAELALNQTEEAWVARARAQILLTTYRLVFRNFYYDDAEGKGQLPLPPPEVWDIELKGEPARMQTPDGHDVVAVDYELTSTLFTTSDSVVRAESALGQRGGTWAEPFVFPIDPELLFQRTGYACMDEAEFPPNSVDGENVATFFDHECTADDTECHITETPELDCTTALERAVGAYETEVVFERLPWDEDLAERVRVNAVTNQTGADLEVIADGLDNNRVIYRYIEEDSCAIAEGCVGGPGWRRLLQFDASVQNLGAQALEIGDVNYYLEPGGETELSRRNIYVYSDCHEHYHFAHYGDFRLGTGTDELGNKQAFCLQSTNRYSNNEHSPLTHDFGSCDFQGIQAGWGDDYGAGLDCQWLDVTNVDTSTGPVSAALTFQANPDEFLCEGVPVLDEDGNPTFEPSGKVTEDGASVERPVCDSMPEWDANNRGERTLTLPVEGGLIHTPCTRGQMGPLRDCGFVSGAGVLKEVECPRGQTLSLSCAVRSDSAPAVLRTCEYSALLEQGVACVYRDSITNSVIDVEPTVVEIECPAARDRQELGGTVSLYTAPLLPGEAMEVVCEVL
ncbi:MAG TPA: lysyl oxidase family protein [Polyangiaceae bacterium]